MQILPAEQILIQLKNLELFTFYAGYIQYLFKEAGSKFKEILGFIGRNGSINIV